MKRTLLKFYQIFSYLLFDPILKVRQYAALPVYINNLLRYISSAAKGTMPLRFIDLYVTTADKFQSAGTASGHYFYQDIWAAKKIHEKGIKIHIDIGSRIDGFVGHLLPFCKVHYVDIRPLKVDFDNLIFINGSILDLPFEDNSIESLSCLHVIEHIGLGRYGDPVDPAGHIKSAKEMIRVLKPGGTLLLGTPVGKERVCFDAHRVFHPKTIADMFNGLKIIEFSLIDDKGVAIIKNADFDLASKCRYGCGLFEFRK